MSEGLRPGAQIGILGGGQLGRMLAMAGARLGFSTHIYAPEAAPPAAQVAARLWSGAYEDEALLKEFAQSVDVITYEFENIPLAALEILDATCRVLPGSKALGISQDRLREKEFLNQNAIAVAPYARVDRLNDLRRAVDDIGPNGILKTRCFGYDGKGQFRVGAMSDLAEIWEACSGNSMIFEGLIDFSCEISVIAARAKSGEIACYDPGENVHEGGILRKTYVPASLAPNLKNDAVLIAGRLLRALDYVGVLGVEFFVSSEGLLVNEFAPRVHNSGHWTQEGCVIDQFEQHIRAVAGLALGDGKRVHDIEMTNLIGDDFDNLDALLKDSANALHLYGKSEARLGRKMGHFNRILRCDGKNGKARG